MNSCVPMMAKYAIWTPETPHSVNEVSNTDKYLRLFIFVQTWDFPWSGEEPECLTNTIIVI